MSTPKAPVRRIKLHNVHLQMVHLDEPEDFQGTKSYKCDIVMAKGDKQIDDISKAVNDIQAEAIKAGFFNYKDKSKFVNPLKDGDDGMAEKYAEYRNAMFISGKSNSQPGIIDLAKNDLTLPAYADKIKKSGMLVHITLTLCAYEAGGKDGVTCYLNNICILKDGEIGRNKAEDDFGEEIAEADKNADAESEAKGKDDDGGF